MGNLYNALCGMDPVTAFILPMLGLHPDKDIPRFRDCFLERNPNGDYYIRIYTRVGGDNRDAGFGQEILENHPDFIRTYDDDFDCTYGWYDFNIPKKWKEDFDKITEGRENEVSDGYYNACVEMFPSLKEKLFDKYLRPDNLREQNISMS